MMVSLGSTVKRRHGFVDDGCQDLIGGGFGGGLRSEERRVGKECW